MRKKLFRLLHADKNTPDDDLLHICQDDSCLRLDLTTYNIGLGASYSLFFDAYSQAKLKRSITPDFAAFVDSFLTSHNDFNFRYPFHTEGDDYYFNYEEDEERIYLWLNVKTATISKFTKGDSLMEDNHISTAESSSALTDEKNDDTNDTALMTAPISAVTSETSDTPIITITEQPSIERLTVEIQFHLNQLRFHVIEVGKRLILAKKLVPHGEWANWLKNNFNLKRQSATNFMNIAERFGKNESDSNFQTFGNIDISTFKPSTLLELLALPSGDEENFIADKAAEGNPVDSMTVKKLRDEINQWKQSLEMADKDHNMALIHIAQLVGRWARLINIRSFVTRKNSLRNCLLRKLFHAIQEFFLR